MGLAEKESVYVVAVVVLSVVSAGGMEAEWAVTKRQLLLSTQIASAPS